MFQVYNNIWFSPWGQILARILPCKNTSPQGFLPMGIFFLQGTHPERNLFNGKVFFCFYSHLYSIWYGSSSVTTCCSETSHILYFRFTWSQTQRQVFIYCCPYTCIHSKAALVRTTFLCHLFIHFAKSLDLDQALHLGPDQDPSCLTLWCFFSSESASTL